MHVYLDDTAVYLRTNRIDHTRPRLERVLKKKPNLNWKNEDVKNSKTERN